MIRVSLSLLSRCTSSCLDLFGVGDDIALYIGVAVNNSDRVNEFNDGIEGRDN